MKLFPSFVPTRGGEKAIAALAGKKYDLALVDISLPDGNGFTVCTEGAA